LINSAIFYSGHREHDLVFRLNTELVGYKLNIKLTCLAYKYKHFQHITRPLFERPLKRRPKL